MPVKIEGIVTDEMYEFLIHDFNTEKFFLENAVEFTRVNEFSGNADITLVSPEKLVEIPFIEGIPDGTFLVENDAADDYDVNYLSSVKHLIPDNKFQWAPSPLSEIAWRIELLTKHIG
jgi:hypothetical protein